MSESRIRPQKSDLLPLAEARSSIQKSVGCSLGTEVVPLTQALGRILRDDVISPLNVPAHTNSALDGYAIDAREIPAAGVVELEVVGTSWAGRPYTNKIDRRQAVRIMTGAPMPAGTDTVIAKEFTEPTEKGVRIDSHNEAGQNVRGAGEDLAAGAVALPRGKRLMPAELGLLASLGLTEIAVYKRLRVAFFSTGDELRQPGESLDGGGVYDSNRLTLTGMLTRLGVQFIDKGIIRDRREEVESALLCASDEADVIITSGGVSTGDADYVEEVLSDRGELGFWRVAIKPGRPLAFGKIGHAVFFGLPGNPVAVMVTFYQLLIYALSTMMGETSAPVVPLLKAKCATALNKKRGRTEFYRAVLESDSQGTFSVRKTAKQGSGVLHSMSEANCFIVLDDECENVEPGTEVSVQPFFGLI